MRACMTLSDDQNKNANEVKELQCVCGTTIKLYMSQMMPVVIFSTSSRMSTTYNFKEFVAKTKDISVHWEFWENTGNTGQS